MIEIQKQKMINELIQKINSWTEFSEQIYGYSKQSAETFLKRLQVGVYNSILKNSYWFVNIPTLDTLIKIEANKKEINSLTNISEENYIVYSTIQEIKEHIDYIYYWNKAYKQNYHTRINNFEQSPQTFEESHRFMKLYNTVLISNYTWREAKHIVRNIESLNIKENKDFPHNIKELEKIFNSSPLLLFKNYEKEKVKYSTNIIRITKTTNNLLNQITEENLQDFIKNKRKDKYEEYVRVILHNLKTTDITKIKSFLNTLLTPKKVLDLSNELIPQPYLTTLRKHYSFIYNYTTEIEFLEETTEILDNLFNLYKDDDDYLYKITIIYSKLLISYGIIPIPLTTNILQNKNKTKLIIDKTINLAEYLNKGH